MNMNELAKEIHQNAVEHGWWEEERSFGEIVALCHSELSEALEQAQKAAQSKIPAKVRYGGGAWRCPRCNAEIRPAANHCENCGQRLEL